MVETNELKDIVLDDKDENSSNKKMRKVLVFVAILVIVFLIVVFVMKILNTKDTQSDARMVIPPEIETNEKIFEQVPIAKSEENSENFDEIVKNLKHKEELRQKDSPKSDPNLNKKDEIIKIEPKIEPKTDPKKPVIIVKKTQPNEKKPKMQITKQNQLKGAYIQVMSVSKVSVSNEFFKKLKKNGYNYLEYKTQVNGQKVTKILVGPYSNAKINAELENIRSKINKDAFIFRIP